MNAMTKNMMKWVIGSSVAALSLATGGCASTCLDDGLLQSEASECPAANSANATTGEPETGAATDGQNASCDDGIRNGDETDVDCGGGCQTKCETGQGCGVDDDCITVTCEDDGRCGGPSATCDDDASNARESDIDCGGNCGATCPPGDRCQWFLDCEAYVCDLAMGTCADPTCDDGAPNGKETDVDCGGPDCAPCPVGGGCLELADCASLLCEVDAGECIAEHCTDGMQNESETDVDCGGTDCAPCDDGQGCTTSTDCISNACGSDDTCATASCDDGVLNQDETDTDCGGPQCDPCMLGEDCAVGTDCESAQCDPQHLECEASSCADGIPNGEETDLDCGGPSCAPCVDGETCSTDADCDAMRCDSGVCTSPTCDDGVRNGGESDIDCGGDICDPCDVGKSCVLATDCTTTLCLLETCTLPTCFDAVKNGAETDVDCGGYTCGPCDDAENCLEAEDCTAQVCTPADNTCSAPSCDDGVRNQDETDIDCGGDICSPCDNGGACLEADDCLSMLCNPGALVCEAGSCNDGVLNGGETDVDCGGPECAACDTGEDCILDGDCVSLSCNDGNGTCDAPACDDGLLNGDETDVDCGGSCQPCSDGDDCVLGNDCISLVCDPTTNTCAAPSCMDGVLNGNETDVDCGGTCGATCTTGDVCVDDGDCETSDCQGGICHTTISFDENDDDNGAGIGQTLSDAACPAVTVFVDGTAAVGGTLDLDDGLLHWRHNVDQSPGLGTLTFSGLSTDSEITLTLSSFNVGEFVDGFNLAPDAYVQVGTDVTLEWNAAIAGAADPLVLTFEMEHIRVPPDNTYLETISISNVDDCGL